MNRYKLELMLKEFSFLDEILRKREDRIFHEDENLIEQALSFYEKELGFRMDKDGNYYTPSYLKTPDGLLVNKGDKNLLARTPFFDSYSWCDGGHYDHESYCAVEKSGDTFQCHWLKEEGSSRTGSGDHDEETASSVGEQLYHLGVSPDYIVEYDFQDTDDNGNGETVLDVTIYKMNKFDLVKYHQQQIDKAAAELKAEIAVVCEGRTI